MASVRGLIGAALASAVLAVGPSYADDTPPPTLTMRTTVDGQPAPTPTAVGQWNVTAPGKSASLEVDGVNPVGGRTKVVGVWTSHYFHPARGTAIDVTWSMDHDGVAASASAGQWNVQSRMHHGGRWSRWSGGRDQPDQTLVAGVTTESVLGHLWIEFPQAPHGQWQFQVRIRYVTRAAGRHTATLAVSAAR